MAAPAYRIIDHTYDVVVVGAGGSVGSVVDVEPPRPHNRSAPIFDDARRQSVFQQLIPQTAIFEHSENGVRNRLRRRWIHLNRSAAGDLLVARRARIGVRPTVEIRDRGGARRSRYRGTP